MLSEGKQTQNKINDFVKYYLEMNKEATRATVLHLVEHSFISMRTIETLVILQKYYELSPASGKKEEAVKKIMYIYGVSRQTVFNKLKHETQKFKPTRILKNIQLKV